MRRVQPLLFIAALLLTGCTTITWSDPSNPDAPVFEYSSGKDIVASGFLVVISYHEDGTPAEIHVEIGSVDGSTSSVLNGAIESAVKAAVEAAGP